MLYDHVIFVRKIAIQKSNNHFQICLLLNLLEYSRLLQANIKCHFIWSRTHELRECIQFYFDFFPQVPRYLQRRLHPWIVHPLRRWRLKCSGRSTQTRLVHRWLDFDNFHINHFTILKQHGPLRCHTENWFQIANLRQFLTCNWLGINYLNI